jgi:diguanylate cyclase (GGDEF)-like protein/PAS domain S-box-containing protein
MTQMLKSLLLIEDNPGDARLIREMLNEDKSHAMNVAHVECFTDAIKYLDTYPVDLILLDLGLPDIQGLEAVRQARAVAPHVPLVVITGLEDETLATQALQEGAQDYLSKDGVDPRGLLRALRYAAERKIMEDVLFEEKERAQITLSCIGDAVVSTDSLGNITFLNLVAEKMSGWLLKEAIGRPIGEVIRIVGTLSGKEDIEFLLPGFTSVHTLADRMLICRDGSPIQIEDSISTIYNRQGVATGLVIVFRDVSANRIMAQKLAYAAEHDDLTDLPNRLLLNDRIAQAIAILQRHPGHLALLFLDMDGFKHINDSLGHPTGDKLLQAIGKRLAQCIRVSDTVSRQGGDEFVVLLSELEHPYDTNMAVKRMLQTVAEPYLIDGHELHVTTSIGVCLYPGDGIDAETLIKNADTAMYQAKQNGRNAYRFFQPAMNHQAVERQSIEEGLRRALDRREFALHYQPKINLRTGLITGAEALLRWTHPTRGAISPASFIPIAEECGLILPISKWVLREACQQARAWLDAGLSLSTIAVNVSAIEFRQENFVDDIFAVLEETGLDPSSLELELTEGVVMRHAESAELILKTLRAKGVKIAIDDFGTGYSSLSYLRKFPIDTLKIDQSFIRQITTLPNETTIISAIIGIGRSLNLTVVAEGVESIEEMAFLQAHLCDEAQGYYFSHPVHPDILAGLIELDQQAFSF